MWCANCHSEVAAEVTADNRHVRCATCGQMLTPPRTTPQLSKTQEARQLLERWANERIVDPYGPVKCRETSKANPGIQAENPQNHLAENDPQKSAPPLESADSISSGTSPDRSSTETKPEKNSVLRFDSAHKHAGTSPESTEQKPPAKEAVTTPEKSATQPSPSSSAETSSPQQAAEISQPRIHQRHSVPAPHFSLQTNSQSEKTTKSNWMVVAGQWLSYLGILGLMSGTGLVILGYFRGPATYVPTGWLVTMAGQMLLFLGVVTMISSGMEQSTDTVTQKIDTLGERILRIEQATSPLRGTKIPLENFATDHAGESVSNDDHRDQQRSLTA
ncbi:MAG: hypothetical protein Tsb009_12730 [Planctomycetaceae bacterium]